MQRVNYKTYEEISGINFVDTFGEIPKSIMKFKKSDELMKLIEFDDFEFGKVTNEKTNKPLFGFDDEPKQEFNKAKPKGGGYAKNLRYSIYNPNQAKFIIEYYTREGDLILDPFMGRATRPMVSLFMNRKYAGFDVCEQTVKSNKELLESKFPNKIEGVDYALYHDDGIYLKGYEDFENHLDAVFTCPPYYNIETYSGEEGDLSYLSHEEFNNRIDILFGNLYRLIKPSNYNTKEFYPVIFTVGSFRKSDEGLLDMDYVFQSIAYKHGFILHDKLFTENVTPGAGFTFRRNYVHKFVCKNYETTLVFLKYK
jgi:DNA modification methylase